jgi:hypothetical protein
MNAWKVAGQAGLLPGILRIQNLKPAWVLGFRQIGVSEKIHLRGIFTYSGANTKTRNRGPSYSRRQKKIRQRRAPCDRAG